MKKTSIKVFGVCAATLLTIGAVAPVAVHAEETGVSIEARDTNSTQTPNNLKTDATVNIARINEFQTFIQKNTINDTIADQDPGDSIALKSVTESIFKELFFDNSYGAVGGNLGLNLYNPNGFLLNDAVEWTFDSAFRMPQGDKIINEFKITRIGDINSNSANITVTFNEGAPTGEYTIKNSQGVGKVFLYDGSGDGSGRSRTVNVNKEFITPGSFELAFHGKSVVKTRPFKEEDVNALWTVSNDKAFLTVNENGLTFLNPEYIPNKKASHIYMTSNFGTDGNIYKAGDKVELKFWTDYGIGTSNQLKQLATTTVTFTGQDEAGDFTTIANTLNGVVGQEYLPFQNVIVKNNNTGATLNPVVITEENNSVFYLAKNGAFELLPGVTSITNLENKLQQYDVNDNEVRPIYNAIYQEFGYEVGNFYFLQDQTDFIAGNRIREEQNIVNGVNRGTKFIFNSVVSDYNQRLHVIVPYFTNSDTKIPNIESNYASRMINVTEDGETPIPEETKVPVYRAYNPNNGDHLFTTSMKEYEEVVDKGWAPEGLAWNAASKEDGTKPVYRLYNPNSGEHFYTDSEKEYNEVGAAGWKQEGIAFYSASVEGGVKIYRSFNPNATGPGSHMFTDSEKEYNELTAAGWSPEGVAFYGMN